MKKALPILMALIAVCGIIFGIVGTTNSSNTNKAMTELREETTRQLTAAKAESDTALAAANEKAAELTGQIETLAAEAEAAAKAAAEELR